MLKLRFPSSTMLLRSFYVLNASLLYLTPVSFTVKWTYLLTSYSLRRRLSATDRPILRKCNIYISGLRNKALTLVREQAVCHEQ